MCVFHQKLDFSKPAIFHFFRKDMLNGIERIVDSKINTNYYNMNHITIDRTHFWLFHDFYTIFEKFHDFLILLSVEYSSKVVKYY